jgi:hypothetical protein
LVASFGQADEGKGRGQEIGISIRHWNKPICSSSSMFCLVIRINLVRRSSSPSSILFLSPRASRSKLFLGLLCVELENLV